MARDFTLFLKKRPEVILYQQKRRDFYNSTQHDRQYHRQFARGIDFVMTTKSEMRTTIKLTILTIVILLPSCFRGSKSPDNELSFEGISFRYPSYWDAKTKESGEGRFYIECEEKFGNGTMFLVSFTTWEIDPEKTASDYVKALENKFSVTKERHLASKFGKYDCSAIKYKMSLPGAKVYGEVYAFNTNGKTVLVVKQSKRDYDLKHEKYKLIENSFNITAGNN